jgi:hypothetical protein
MAFKRFDMPEPDVEPWNARLRRRAPPARRPRAGRARVGCAVEFFGGRAPVAMFNAYLVNGMVAGPTGGAAFSLSPGGESASRTGGSARLPRPN